MRSAPFHPSHSGDLLVGGCGLVGWVVWDDMGWVSSHTVGAVMATKPKPCPPAPGPLEDYCARFDHLLRRLPQRRGFRDYLAGLMAPRERNKTLTALADVEPVVGASHPEAQRLQFFLTESVWDPDAVNDQRLQVLCEDPATAPHPGG